MIYTKHKAFTLVELIVVVTILAILATIGFVSYSSYLTGVRDTNRISQLTSISDGLNLYSTKNSLPIPDDNVEVSVNGSLIAYQGTAGANTLETIDFTKGGKDPRDDTYFSYYLTKDRKHFQLMGFLEESESIASSLSEGVYVSSPSSRGMSARQGEFSFVSSAYAVDYTDRIPTVNGRKLGILTNDENTPLEQLGANLDITSGTTGYIAHMTSDTALIDADLLSINPIANCKRIKQMKGSSQDGVYTINPTGADGSSFKVYCDMTTDGGGWTYATMLADNTTRNLFDTGNTDKIISLTENISSKGTISDIWLGSMNKDIMLICKTTSEIHKGYEAPFIIYEFQKSDIGNLEKDVKQNTSFASSSLTVKYNNKKFQLGLGYLASGGDNSHYITDSNNEIVFALASGVNINVTSDITNWSNLGPSYTSGSTVNQTINLTNYCMSAIR